MPAEATANNEASQWQLAIHLVEVLLSGAFVLGLTTVSGAVWYAGQLRGIGLTGSEAISALPRSELLTKGADQLIPFALIAAAEVTAVLLVIALWNPDKKPAGHWPLDRDNTVAAWTSCFLVVCGAVLLLVRAGPPTGRGFLGWIGTLAIVVIGALIVFYLMYDPETVSRSQRAGMAAEASPNAKEVESVAPDANSEVSVSAPRDIRKAGSPVPRNIAWGLVALAVTTILFGMAMAYPRGFGKPTARPGAVLLVDRQVISGAWIGATSQWLYVGNVCWNHPGRHGLVLSIPRARVVNYVYGKLEPLKAAYRDLPHTKAQALMLAQVSGVVPSTLTPAPLAPTCVPPNA